PRLRHRPARAVAQSRFDSCMWTVADAARRRSRRQDDRRARAALAGRNVCLRRRRLLGVRRTAPAHERAGDEFSTRIRGRQRRRARAHLQRGAGLWERRAAMVAMQPSLALKLGKLELPYPTLMGSGCYGSGEEFAKFTDLRKIGAVVLKSVT